MKKKWSEVFIMSRRIILLLFILFASSCSGRYSNLSKYHYNGSSKPSVTLVPLYDHSDITLPWNLSNELTTGIREYLADNNKFYIATPEDTKKHLPELGNIDLTSTNHSFSNVFKPNEFVILVELIDHQKIPYKRQSIRPVYPADGKIDHVLSMKARIKVLDIREEKPKLVLQEILKSNHLIPEQIASITPEERPWGSKTYYFSPIGIAHRRLERDIAARLEDYIMIAKSKS